MSFLAGTVCAVCDGRGWRPMNKAEQRERSRLLARARKYNEPKPKLVHSPCEECGALGWIPEEFSLEVVK